MKYLVILTDGAADEPLSAYNNKTPLEVAEMPNAKRLAERSLTGMVKTVPDGMAPGSDVANLAVMGYDPKIYHTGRSPLEAASIGVDLKPTDVSYRTNTVTLASKSGSFNADVPYSELVMVDHGANDISSEEAGALFRYASEKLAAEFPSMGIEQLISFYTGVSYRNCMVVGNGKTGHILTPPHDILGQPVKDYLPKGADSDFILRIMARSYELMKDHPINKARIERGLHPANSFWIWGEGTKPALNPIAEKYGVTGSVISAVDLIKGIGILAGLNSIDVEGATGTLDTNYTGKALAAMKEFDKGMEFVYVHIEATDEAGHAGRPDEKVEALNRIDRMITGPLMDYLEKKGEPYRILLLPDHPTPMRTRTHSPEPVPFVLYDSKVKFGNPENAYTEKACAGGPFYKSAIELTDFFFRK